MPDTPPTSAACCPVHALGKCDAVFTCCDRCPTFFADRAKPIYGKPFHGWSCDCDECKGYDERGEPRPGEAPRPQASAATDLTAPCPVCGFYRDTPNHVHGCNPRPDPGACGDPECYVLHRDPAHPIHPHERPHRHLGADD